jgi:L,D-peptidoglycan transpeptidase YkuD (ErfK/YbiS/YcfS/YnhG family)
MTILIKNKHTLQIDEFKFKCCIGKNGTTSNKKEGDKKTPKGIFGIDKLYFRNDRKKKPSTFLKCIKIKKNIKHEKLKRKDFRYDFLIPIKFNFQKPIAGKGSCIFIHLTKNYKPTAGCIALKEKDFLIMLKLIKQNSKIKIS